MKKKVLLVEDEAVTATGLERILWRLGYDVMGPCLAGEVALRMAAQERPDVALMDIRLVGRISGITTAIELRELYDVPSVFLTGQNTEQARLLAQEARPAAFLIKPVSEHDLHQTIQAALQQSGPAG